MDTIPAGDQEAFEYQVMREKWYEERDEAVQTEQVQFLAAMKIEDVLEAVENAPKDFHDEMWAAMRNEDIVWMKEVLRNMCERYAKTVAEDIVDRRIR